MDYNGPVDQNLPGCRKALIRRDKERLMRFAVGFLGLLVMLTAGALAADGNRLTYLDESDPYYVSRDFPKLVTPQWVGEEGVEAVVILAIDDMREPEK